MKKRGITKWWYWLIACILTLLIIHIMFKIPAPFSWLESTWESGNLLSFIGTITLGFVAVYQTYEANAISTKLMEKEISAATPFIDIRAITEKEFETFMKQQTLFCAAEGCNSHFDDNNINDYTDGEILYFKIKNTRNLDILSLNVIALELGVDTGECVHERTVYSAGTTFYAGYLNQYDEIPFVVTIPPDWFCKVADYSVRQDDDHSSCSLFISFTFNMTNNDGNKYTENICLEAYNAYMSGMKSCVFLNKELSKVKREDS